MTPDRDRLLSAEEKILIALGRSREQLLIAVFILAMLALLFLLLGAHEAAGGLLAVVAVIAGGMWWEDRQKHLAAIREDFRQDRAPPAAR